MRPSTALVAEDEVRLGDELCESLQRHWPELRIVGRASTGSEALSLWERTRPSMLFLDIQMPGGSGLDVARAISGRSHVVFVTAYSRYAVEAFERGAVDYLLKPLDSARLAITVDRLKRCLDESPTQIDDVLKALATPPPPPPNYLRWVTAALGQELRVITNDEILFFRAENKYTVVATADHEAVMTTPIRELAPQLDPGAFRQIHRGTIVNVRKIAAVRRNFAGQLFVSLRDRKEVLPVSARYAHLFRQM